MYKIVKKTKVADVVTRMEIDAPLIAKKAKPGQFIIFRASEEGERVPLTIFSAQPDKGTITIIFQIVGKSTMLLNTLNEGDSLTDLVGPLGKAAHVEKIGHVVAISGGVGAAIGYPVTRGFKEAGNKVTCILGARNKDLLLLEDELEKVCDDFKVCTDDGSKGMKGFVSDALKQMVDGGVKVDLVYAVGPLPMMRVLADTTRPYGIKTMVSLDSLMLDGTGMCGACRVSIGGETKFTCVDGPEFDGHLVDWDILRARKMIYVDQEKLSKERFQEKCQCSK